MVETIIMDTHATIHHGIWSCEDDAVLELLIVETEAFDTNPPLYVPDFDMGCADYLIKKYGGRIVSAPAPPSQASQLGICY